MFFRMIYDSKLAQAAYLIGCQRTGEAIVIDPMRNVAQYEKIAAEEGLKLTAVTETHIHADFLSGAREMAEKYGVKAYLSDEGGEGWQYTWMDKKSGGGSYDYQLLKDGDTFKIGNIEFKALHTPGHTPEHMSFMVTDYGGGASEPMGIATGDFVFVGDVGRPDLLETAAGVAGAKEESAKVLYKSIQKFKDYPDYLQLWPGHGAGSACGKALGAVPQSTVGYEKRFNAAINSAVNEAKFVESIIYGQPEPPYYFARMKRDNKVGPAILGNGPAPKNLTPAELLAARKDGAALLDTRLWNNYVEGHLSGAMFTPLDKSFPTIPGSYVEEDQPIYLVIAENNLSEAIHDLTNIGLDNIVGYTTPDQLKDYAATGGELERTEHRPMTDLKKCPTNEPFLVLDVRRQDEYDAGHLAGTINIAHTRLLPRQQEIPKDRPIWVHCRTGVRSSYAVGYLQSLGYNAVQLDGGYVDWVAADGIVV